MQVTKAKLESDHLADEMELERILKESKAEFCGARDDELQRVLKESSVDYVRKSTKIDVILSINGSTDESFLISHISFFLSVDVQTKSDGAV